eukprot:gb/GECH01010728.1/.p1 GENE.gb/GECH01010728.1/~~gb/GECH01010728.1/.p1  ORF type:complete len:240 (+),score=35.35 gb/GECH01010728.1/:1-720(+)
MQKISNPKDNSTSPTQDNSVYDILQSLELVDFWPEFEKNRVTSINILQKLTMKDLEDMNLPVGPRRALLEEIEKLNGRQGPGAPSEKQQQNAEVNPPDTQPLQHKPPTTNETFEINYPELCCCFTTAEITIQYNCAERKLYQTRQRFRCCLPVGDPEVMAEYSFDDLLYIDAEINHRVRINDRIVASSRITTRDGTHFGIPGGGGFAAKVKSNVEDFSERTGIPIREIFSSDDVLWASA